MTEGKTIVAKEPMLGLDGIVIMGNSQITEQALRFAVKTACPSSMPTTAGGWKP